MHAMVPDLCNELQDTRSKITRSRYERTSTQGCPQICLTVWRPSVSFVDGGRMSAEPHSSPYGSAVSAHLVAQDGVVSREQLLSSGCRPHDIERLLRRRE